MLVSFFLFVVIVLFVCLFVYSTHCCPTHIRTIPVCWFFSLSSLFSFGCMRLQKEARYLVVLVQLNNLKGFWCFCLLFFSHFQCANHCGRCYSCIVFRFCFCKCCVDTMEFINNELHAHHSLSLYRQHSLCECTIFSFFGVKFIFDFFLFCSRSVSPSEWQIKQMHIFWMGNPKWIFDRHHNIQSEMLLLFGVPKKIFPSSFWRVFVSI